jgi:hypothetical protein
MTKQSMFSGRPTASRPKPGRINDESNRRELTIHIWEARRKALSETALQPST